MSKSQPSGDPLLNTVLGDYSIKRLIAKGGMGRVYEATDNQLNRQVAVKVITLEEEVADELMLRFQREARVIGQLDNHPNIVTIYRYGKEEGVHYIAMKYIRGQSLADYMKALERAGRKIDHEEMLHILGQVAAALDYAHDRGVIHRDVKPANIMLENDPRYPDALKTAILMDFGLVLQVDSTMTTGTAFGTPRYIAPEQALASADACAQSDIYALGVIVYELMTGAAPFEEGDSPIAIALSHVTKPPPAPSTLNPDISEPVERVILKVLEKKPQDRYQRASDFVNALERALHTGRGATGIVPVAPASIFDLSHDKPTAKVDVSALRPNEPPDLVITGEYKSIGQQRDYVVPSLLVLLLVVGVVALLYFGVLRGEAPQSPTQAPTAVVQAGDVPKPTSPEVAAEVIRDGSLALLWGDDWLVIRNPGGIPLDLRGVTLRNGERVFSLRDVGESMLGAWQPGACAYVTLLDTPLAERPETCNPAREREPLRYLSAADFAWNTTEDFVVLQDGRELGRCEGAQGSCTITGVRLP